MAVYEFIPYINSAERLADSESLIAQTQADNAFAEQLLQQAIAGVGNVQAARHLQATVRQLLGNARVNQQFWMEVAKGDKDQYKKSGRVN